MSDQTQREILTEAHTIDRRHFKEENAYAHSIGPRELGYALAISPRLRAMSSAPAAANISPQSMRIGPPEVRQVARVVRICRRGAHRSVDNPSLGRSVRRTVTYTQVT